MRGSENEDLPGAVPSPAILDSHTTHARARACQPPTPKPLFLGLLDMLVSTVLLNSFT